jgi:hypothetical protein
MSEEKNSSTAVAVPIAPDQPSPPATMDELKTMFVLFFAAQFAEFCEGESHEGWQELAEKFGMIEAVEFDPDKHDDPQGILDPGDTIYVMTEQARRVVKAVRAQANAAIRKATASVDATEGQGSRPMDG